MTRTNRLFVSVGLAFLMVCSTSAASWAQLLAGSKSVDVVFDQTISILPDNPLMIPPGDIPLSTAGSFSVSWDDESGGEALVNSFTASGSGFVPGLGNYTLDVPGTGPGATATGSLTDITSAAGELIMGDLGMNLTFSVVFPDAGGLTLYTQVPAFFLGILEGGSNVGNTYQDPAEVPMPDNPVPIDIYTTVIDPMTMQPVEFLVAQSSNRIATAVPEPTSLVLLVWALVGMLHFRSLGTV